MSVEGLTGRSLEAGIAAIARGEFTISELTAATLDALDTVGARLNAVARTEPDYAMQRAAELDALSEAQGSRLPLRGAVLAHKDLYMRSNWTIEAGSRLLAGRRAERTAGVIDRLDKAGATDCARLNTVEFALGVTGHNEITGHVRNPWNPDYVTGGSSSGSGAAVAAGIVPAALGSDTGGSIRLPAGACGLVGLKPTAGLVGRSGVFPLSTSLDTVGPLTRTVRDCALMLQSLAGYDCDDAASLQVQVPDYLEHIEDGVSDLRIGIADNYFFDDLETSVGEQLDAAIAACRALGAQLRSVHVDGVELCNRLTTLIIAVEGAATHSGWLKRDVEKYGSQCLGRLMTGLFVPAEAYLRALDYRGRFLRGLLDTVYTSVDLLLVPMWPSAVPTITESDLSNNPGFSSKVVAWGHCSRPFNFAGLPALTLPCGLDGNGLPVGVQLVARPFEEALLLRAARALERRFEFADHKPAVSVW